jgi:hypothetical protein
MNVLFHSNQLGIRGTEIALYDYAHYNETILGNTSYIAAPINSDRTSNEKFVNRFGADRILLYNDFSSLQPIVERLGITHAYYIKGGENDGKLIPGVKNFAHAVFDGSQPHGDVYMTVSKWLGDKFNLDYLPHIVSLPEVTANYRDYLGIPQTATVFGRYGGYDQFDVPYLDEVIKNALSNENIYFLFMNTKPLSAQDHPRVIYLDGTTDVETKTAFINTCDVMLHGRTEGETFGLAVAEFLHQNKPVITNISCRDRHHIELMGSKGFYYESKEELWAMIARFQKKDYHVKQLVDQFNPEIVINKFKESFLI